MKKLLSIIGVMSISVSSITTVSCVIGDYKKQAIEKSINDVIQFASLAVEHDVLSDVNNINPQYVNDYYIQKNIADVMPGYKYSQAKVGDIYNLYFGKSDLSLTNDNVNTYNNLNLTGQKTPINKDLNDNISNINMGVTLLSRGFTPAIAKQFIRSLGSDMLKPLIINLTTALSGLIKTFTINNKEYNLLTGLSNAFNDSVFYKNGLWTFQDVVNSSVIDIVNFIHNLTLDFNKPDYSKFINDNIKITDMSTVYQQLKNDLNLLLNGQKIDWLNALLGYYGVPSIIRFLGIMINYVNQFNLALTDKDIKNINFLFDKNLSNIQIKNKILSSVYNNKTSLGHQISWQLLSRMLWLFFGYDKTQDSLGYNLAKLIDILFNNNLTSNSENTGYGNFFRKLIDIILDNKINFSVNIDPNKKININWNFIKITFLKNTSPVDLFLKTLTNGEGWLSFLNQLKYTINTYLVFINKQIKDIPILKNIFDFIDTPFISSCLKNPFLNFYSNEHFIPEIFDFIGKQLTNPVPLLQKISDLKDIKNIFSLNIGNLLNTFNINPINIFYFLNNVSTTQLFGAFANLVNVKKEDKYQITDYFLEKNKYAIDLNALNYFFNYLGTNAKVNLDKTKSAIHGFEYPIFNNKSIWSKPENFSTLVYGLKILSSPKVINAGASPFLTFFGLDNKNDIFWKDSGFKYLANIYENNNLNPNDSDPQGMLKFFMIINNLLKVIQNGMYKNEKENFIKYFNPINWWETNKIVIKTKNTQIIQFNLNYQNLDNHKIYKYFIELNSSKNLSDNIYPIYQFKIIKKVA